MSAKIGRPKSESKKSYMLRIRLNDDELEKLEYCCKTENKSKSELIRCLLLNFFESLQ